MPPLVCEKKEGTTRRRNWFAGEDNVVMETSSSRSSPIKQNKLIGMVSPSKYTCFFSFSEQIRYFLVVHGKDHISMVYRGKF